MTSELQGQEDNGNLYMYIMVIGTCMILIMIAGFVADNNRNMLNIITEHNLNELERCAILDCRATLSGHIQCTTLQVEDIVNDQVVLWDWNSTRGVE